jgi:HAAS domain-containing protein
MTVDTQHPLAADYLKRLRRAARRLPPGRRAELVAEIEAHLADALDPRATDPEAQSVLDRLGAPEAIVAAEQPVAAAARAKPRGTKEWFAIVLLLFGGFIAGFGWLVGVILLWSSRAWTTREKWIGTLLVPGGLALPFFLLGAATMSGGRSCAKIGNAPQHCTAEPSTAITWIVVVAALVLASIGSSMYLARRARTAP